MLPALRRRQQPVEPIDPAELHAAEGKAANSHRALATHGSLKTFDGKLAKSVDREIGDLDGAERQMIDAVRFHREPGDGQSPQGKRAEQPRRVVSAQPLHPRLRHVGIDHDRVEKLGEAGRRLADAQVFRRRCRRSQSGHRAHPSGCRGTRPMPCRCARPCRRRRLDRRRGRRPGRRRRGRCRGSRSCRSSWQPSLEARAISNRIGPALMKASLPSAKPSNRS